jgi:RHS repeat-associated protein
VSDDLGSPRIILGKSGSLVDTKRRDFMPFGEDLGAGQFGRTTAPGYEPSGTPSNPREKFATYERDDETGLDFAQARYYQNRLGRFTSVDPLMASAAPIEPQSWNRYGYVGNRPLVVTDPTGMVWGYNKDKNKYQWFAGDELTDELKNEGWSAVSVMLGANGRWVDLGYAGPTIDFQHGPGTEFSKWYVQFAAENVFDNLTGAGLLKLFKAAKVVQTGARQGALHEWEAAETAYDLIRQSGDDVSAIAKNTG